MEVLIILIPLSLVALGVAVWFFFRMNASGQFDDADGPAWSVVLDDDSVNATDSQHSKPDKPAPRTETNSDGPEHDPDAREPRA